MEKLPKEAVVFSHYVGDLDSKDMQDIANLKRILDKKLSINDRVLDIQKMVDYMSKPEMRVRQMLNYIENNVYYGKEFAYINGGSEYERIDSFRAAEVQKRAASQNA